MPCCCEYFETLIARAADNSQLVGYTLANLLVIFTLSVCPSMRIFLSLTFFDISTTLLSTASPSFFICSFKALFSSVRADNCLVICSTSSTFLYTYFPQRNNRCKIKALQKYWKRAEYLFSYPLY